MGSRVKVFASSFGGRHGLATEIARPLTKTLIVSLRSGVSAAGTLSLPSDHKCTPGSFAFATVLSPVYNINPPRSSQQFDDITTFCQVRGFSLAFLP